MIRLVATDVDGTLIGHDGVLPDDRERAVRRLTAAGVPLTLATGKIWPSIRPLWEHLELPGPHVTCNGAAVVDGDGRLRHCLPLDTEVADAVVEVLVSRGIPHAVYLEDGTLVTTERVATLDILPELGEPDPVVGAIDGRRVLKVLSVVAADDEGDLRHVAADAARIQRTSHRFLEWNHPTADKAAGLRVVVDHLGVGLHEVVAVGDAENDVPMLVAAGTGIAVAAASQAAIDGADLHLRSDLTDYLDEVAAAAERDGRGEPTTRTGA